MTVFTGQTAYCNGNAAATTARTVVVRALALSKLTVSPRHLLGGGAQGPRPMRGDEHEEQAR